MGRRGWARTRWRIWSSGERDCMTSWPRPAISGAARSVRTIAAAASPIVCARKRVTPGMGRDICGRARWPGGVPRGGSSRSRRWTRCAPSWPTITVSRRSVSRSWRSTRRSARPAHRTRRPRRPRPAQRGTKKGALRPDRGGVHRRGRAAGCARGRCAGILGADLVAVELAIRTAMTRLGSSLLEQLLGADTGHRGQRIDCGQGHCAWFVGYRDKNLDTVLDRVRLLRACYHCRTCGRGMAPPGSGTWPPRSCPKPPRSWTSTTLASTSTTSPASSHPPSANTTVTG
ncbi:conserved hypothetical protein [Mycobacterium tuberculosis]|nr:conserved hypothetical protein [Mycobacterium tuberculosis]